jgi:tRNA1Val (adenine37-N6)-methyltransferase
VKVDEDVLIEESETVDEILGGSLRIIQKKKGYRFSVDALLLAHFAGLREWDDLIDLGTGSGIVALIMANRCCSGRVLGIEIQEHIAAMAQRSATLNGLADRVAIRQGDIRSPETISAPLSFDVALFNPPYRRFRSGRMNPNPEKAMARHEIAGTGEDFLAAAFYLLRRGGRASTIYPASRTVELLHRMRVCQMEPKRLRIIYSRPNGVGKFTLVEGVKGGREELVIMPPLSIYSTGNRYSEEMVTIFRELSTSPAHVAV